MFEKMQLAGVAPTEHVSPQKFWADAKKRLNSTEGNGVSCVLDDMERQDKGVCLDCTV